jgi:hypothetical protein
MAALQKTRAEAVAEGAEEKKRKWALRFFSYDHLTLVNPAAYEDVGGWDTLIPYYMTDCDMHARLAMRGWGIEDAKAGIITDVASALEDLSALYRVEGVPVGWVDPNPPPPKNEEEEKKKGEKEKGEKLRRDDAPAGDGEEKEDPNLAKWNALRAMADQMFRTSPDSVILVSV